MSNKPRKKKKKPTKKCRPVQASSAFDNYEQYETTMDNVIQLLNTQYDIAPPKDHDEEIALIYQYLIDKFGDTSTTAFKLHEVLISLAHRRARWCNALLIADMHVPRATKLIFNKDEAWEKYLTHCA